MLNRSNKHKNNTIVPKINQTAFKKIIAILYLLRYLLVLILLFKAQRMCWKNSLVYRTNRTSASINILYDYGSTENLLGHKNITSRIVFSQ